jgi:hypothetical protein
MGPAAVLQRNREAIVSEWFDRIIQGYPRNAYAFLAKQKDRFRNPVGHAISEALGPIYDQVISEMDSRALSDALDTIVRIRSVQDFTASQAVGFVFGLKAVIRDALTDEARPGGESEVLAELDARIDRVALLAFDKYTECREQLHNVRANEIRARWERMLARSGDKEDGVTRKETPDK